LKNNFRIIGSDLPFEGVVRNFGCGYGVYTVIRALILTTWSDKSVMSESARSSEYSDRRRQKQPWRDYVAIVQISV
jgi:hypothetical protein